MLWVNMLGNEKGPKVPDEKHNMYVCIQMILSCDHSVAFSAVNDESVR